MRLFKFFIGFCVLSVGLEGLFLGFLYNQGWSLEKNNRKWEQKFEDIKRWNQKNFELDSTLKRLHIQYRNHNPSTTTELENLLIAHKMLQAYHLMLNRAEIEQSPNTDALLKIQLQGPLNELLRFLKHFSQQVQHLELKSVTLHAKVPLEMNLEWQMPRKSSP